jgi:hypothetical protein
MGVDETTLRDVVLDLEPQLLGRASCYKYKHSHKYNKPIF